MKRQLALIVALCLGVGVSLSAQSGRYNTGITVYSDPNFRGESATFRNDTPDLRGYGLNDKVSSIEISNGESWEICQDVNYGNRCQVISGSISNLREMGWNDRVSSLRRVNSRYGNNQGWGGIFNRRNNTNESLRFFDRTDFRGSSTVVTNDRGDLSFVGRPRSVEVTGGTWELCDRSGRCATISRDISDLNQLGLRDRLRSAYLVDDNRNIRGNGRNGNGRANGRNRNNNGTWWP